MPSYQPVNCKMHSLLELHIMHGDELTVYWQDDHGITQIKVLQPVDITTEKNTGEFLLLNDRQSNNYKIRLDKIQQFEKARM